MIKKYVLYDNVSLFAFYNFYPPYLEEESVKGGVRALHDPFTRFKTMI
jgi:hypothetical protein